jgi:hypothetical protein
MGQNLSIKNVKLTDSEIVLENKTFVPFEQVLKVLSKCDYQDNTNEGVSTSRSQTEKLLNEMSFDSTFDLEYPNT